MSKNDFSPDLQKIIMAAEDKIRWHRTPTGLHMPGGVRYIRVMHAGINLGPPERMGTFDGIEVLGYTTARGVVSRVFYVYIANGWDGALDGCGEWITEDRYGGKCVNPASVRLQCGCEPPQGEKSSEATIAEEFKHRAEVIAYFEKAAAVRTAADIIRAAKLAAAAARKAAQEAAAAPVLAVAPPPKPPKKKWWQW